MSRFRRDRKRKALREFLARGHDSAIAQLVWAVDALQSGREDKVNSYLNFPSEAITEDLLSKYMIYKWELEALITLSLKWEKFTDSRKDTLLHHNFPAAAEAANLLRDIEQQETKLTVDVSNIMMEMYKMAQLQFPWQRPFFGPEQLYRYLYIYGQGDCAAFFEEKYGLSVNEFTQVATFMFFGFRDVPWLARPPFEEFGLRADAVEAGLNVLSIHGPQARQKAAEMAGAAEHKRILHQRSLLRTYPLLSFDVPQKLYIAPLPDLIAYRMSVGLYYDMVSGPKALLDEANERFEEYAKLYIKARMPRFDVSREQAYGPKKTRFDTPDILIRDAGQIKVVCECKATKLTFDGQFSDDPIEAAKGAFDQLVKAVFQLWRFFAHARIGTYDIEPVAADALGIVLTMDMWFRLSGELKVAVIAKARTRAQTDSNITETDMRPVVFCSMYDLDNTMARATEDTFLEAVRQNGQEQFLGFELGGVLQELDLAGEKRPFPFDVGDMMPWYGSMVDSARRQNQVAGSANTADS